MDGSFEDVYKKKILQSVCMSNFSSMTDPVTGQECIPLGCISPAFLIPGGVPTETLPGQRPPPEGTWDQATREKVTSYRDPPEGIWDQTARQEVTSYRDHPQTIKHL